MVALLKGLSLIVVLVTLSSWCLQRLELVYNGTLLAGGGSATPSQVYLALPVVLLALSALFSRWMGQGERVVVYVGVVMGVSVVSSGLLHRFLPGLVTGFYGGFADPSGSYFRFLGAVPRWLVPGFANEEPVVAAFEGGSSVLWAAWLMPLCVWTIFFAALFVTSLSLVLLLRQCWLNAERLPFPLLELPVALLNVRHGEASVWARRCFWGGILVPVVLFGINGIHHYWPALGSIDHWIDLGDFLLEEPWRSMAPLQSRFVYEFSPLLIGVVFLMPVEVSFSTWVFFLFSRFQLLVTRMVGLTEYEGSFIPGHGSPWLDWPSHAPFLMSQARGGLFFLALFSLWTARRSLAQEIALRNPAVWGLLIGFSVLWAWCVGVGLSPLAAVVALLLYFLLAIAYMRLRLDGGLPVTGVYQIVGYLFFVALGSGPGLFTDQTYVAFAFLGVLGYTTIGLWPALQLEGFKLAEACAVSVRRMALAMGVGLAVGLVSGYVFALETIYDHGIHLLQEQGGGRGAALIGRFYNYLYRAPGTVFGETDWVRLGSHGVGAVVTWILSLLRGLFLRWPLHPMGFVYGTGFGALLWGPALTGWMCKWLTVRYGGATTYRQVRPFFLGMICGELTIRVMWAGVALWQGEVGAAFRMV